MVKGRQVKLAPSILSADFGCLGEQVAELTRAGADYIHIDVMDGHFVPNITIGAPVVASLRRWTNLPLDVHLMIEHPEKFISQFAEAGASIITVHVEACPHLRTVVQEIKDRKINAGVSVNPETPIDSLAEILDSIDLALIMTVSPGFGGQPFMPHMLGKVRRLRQELDERKLSVELEVDGGITAELAPVLVNAGATVLVAGAAIFNTGRSITEALQKIKRAISSVS